jgi:integrase
MFTMAERIIIRQGSRILTPKEYAKLRENLDPNFGYRIISDVLLNTGLRIVEFWNLSKHKEWYHGSARVIDLPAAGACKKPKCKKTDRTIKLTANGCKALDTFFGMELEFRDRTAMREALIRAAIKAGFGKEGINPKMFRKCLVSWLVECRKDLGIDSLEITATMGHSQDTMIDNYLGIGFGKDDHIDMLEFLKGWSG